jgi:hypothetical protein
MMSDTNNNDNDATDPQMAATGVPVEAEAGVSVQSLSVEDQVKRKEETEKELLEVGYSYVM